MKTSFFRAALLNYGTSLLASVLSLGNVLIIARSLDATGRGEVAFLTTVAMLTAALVAFGFAPATATFAGRRPESSRALATNSIVAAVACGALGAGGVALLIALVPAVGGDLPTDLLWLAISVRPPAAVSISAKDPSRSSASRSPTFTTCQPSAS